MQRILKIFDFAYQNIAMPSLIKDGFSPSLLDEAGFDGRRQEVYLYRELYISEDADTLNHEYAYASKMKLSGAISTRKLDLVLMNREAYDVLSESGYLQDLSALPASFDSVQVDVLLPLLTENEVVVSDNSLEVMLDEAEEEQRVTQSVRNALTVSSLPLFRNAGFDGDLYLGAIPNNTHSEQAALFLEYILP